MSSVCKKCPPNTDVYQDPERGEVLCTGCGAVLESQAIVSEIQYSESNGRSTAVGQFISADGRSPIIHLRYIITIYLIYGMLYIITIYLIYGMLYI